MTTKKNVVRVTILGDEYSIRSDASPERTRAVAEYGVDVIKQTMRAGNIDAPQKGGTPATTTPHGAPVADGPPGEGGERPPGRGLPQRRQRRPRRGWTAAAGAAA